MRAYSMVVVALLVMVHQRAGPAVSSGHAEPWKRHLIDDSSLGADGVRAADANGDGLLDLVTGWEQGGITRMYLSSRSGQTAPTWRTVTVGKTPDVEDAVFFDADGDGLLDVISSTEGDSRKVFVLWAPRKSALYAAENAWTTETLLSNGSRWMFAVPMNVDGSRGVDLVIGGKDEGASVAWLEAPADPRRVRDWKLHHLSDAGWIMSLILDDMNHDGHPDILLSDRRGMMAGVRWLQNPGPQSRDLTKPWTNHPVGAAGREAMFIDTADLDGDGVKEIVVPHYAGNDWRLSVFKFASPDRKHGAWREYSIRYPAIAGRPKSVAIGDIDVDGRSDIVLAGEQAYRGKRGIVWLRSPETPFDSDWDVFDVSGPDGVKFDLSLLLDVDRDGDLDIINSEENDNAVGGKSGLGVVWYENPLRSKVARN